MKVKKLLESARVGSSSLDKSSFKTLDAPNTYAVEYNMWMDGSRGRWCHQQIMIVLESE
jgi:hypothetical protein